MNGLTPQGKVTALLALGFGLGALNTGTNLLYLIAALILGALVVNARVAARAVAGVVARGRAPARVAQGEALEVRLEVERGARGLAHPVEVDLLAPEGAVEGRPGLLVLGVAPGGSVEGVARAVALRRGPLRLEARAASVAPFGLARREARAEGEQGALETLVVPPVRAVRAEALSSIARPTEGQARRPTAAPERRDLVRGLREHRPGDDLRAVHWAATARRGALVVKEFERPAPQDALVAVHLAGEPGGEAADAAAEVAASVAAALLRRGERVALAVAGRGPAAVVPAGAGEHALERLLDALGLAAAAPEVDVDGLSRACRRHAATRVLVVSTRPGALAGVDLGGARVLGVAADGDAARWIERPAARRGAPAPAGAAA